MDAIRRTDEKASRLDVAERDVRALTEYLTVLENVGRARSAEGLYLVVSQSGREYLVDAEQGACECEDFRYRDTACKHVRRVAFATGNRAIPTAAAIELDFDPSLGEHVEGERRYVSTDGGDGEPDRSEDDTAVDSSDDPADDSSDKSDDDPGDDLANDSGDDSRDDSWFVRDRDRNRVREFETRDAAERAIADLEDLGLDVELVSAAALGEGVIDAPTLVDDRESTRDPARIDPEAADLDERSVGEDPLEWLPEAFVDVIDGTPAINRKGFEVLAHFYDVDVETEVQVGPADTGHEYCQVKATATMPNGRRCEALASAHVDRGDDPHLLLEMADTRARKRAISIATGMGVVAVEELENRPEPA